MKQYEQRITEYERGVLAEIIAECRSGDADSIRDQRTVKRDRKRQNQTVNTELQICTGA